jgi:immune inhibitor A
MKELQPSATRETTMIERELLEGIARIYQAARDSEDGERCMVAPSPDLRERIKTAIAAMRATRSLPEALSLRAAEPRVLGLNDGVIYPSHDFAAGTSRSIIRSAAARIAGPLRGTVRVIVVLVDFSDKHMSQTQQTITICSSPLVSRRKVWANTIAT